MQSKPKTTAEDAYYEWTFTIDCHAVVTIVCLFIHIAILKVWTVCPSNDYP